MNQRTREGEGTCVIVVIVFVVVTVVRNSARGSSSASPEAGTASLGDTPRQLARAGAGAGEVVRRRRRHALRRRHGHLRGRCPTGSEVQSILVPRSKFSVEEAKHWASHHGFKASKVDVTDQYIRLRQRDPKGLGRMRTIRFGTGGVKAVVGWRHCK